MEIPEGYRGILILMRGVPGSGKSHRAERLAGDAKNVFSTDQWFDMQPGGYLANWKMEKLFAAHKWNQNRVRLAMQRGVSPIVVDNTNLRIKEARPYVEMANQYQYFVKLEEADSPWWAEIKELLNNKITNKDKIQSWARRLTSGFKHGESVIKNIHGVPEDVIHRMLVSYSPYSIEDVQSRIKMGEE